MPLNGGHVLPTADTGRHPHAWRDVGSHRVGPQVRQQQDTERCEDEEGFRLHDLEAGLQDSV